MVLKVEKSNDRLDKFITNNTTYSRAIVNKLIAQGLVTVNDEVKKASYQVKLGDVISVGDYQPPAFDLQAEAMSLDIIYEDDQLMVINKPSGLVVHPGNGHQEHTLVNGLINYTNQLSNLSGDFRLGIVHRLDKDTSGLMLVAKTNGAHQFLTDGFKTKQIKRTYVALLDGVFPHETATIDAPIGRSNNDRQQLTVTADNAKSALTQLKVLKRYENNTLVELDLATGRTHQIRVHMKYIGYPVHNDPLYNKAPADAFGQFLHAKKLTFIHPVTREPMSFECPLPKLFQDYLDSL